MDHNRLYLLDNGDGNASHQPLMPQLSKSQPKQVRQMVKKHTGSLEVIEGNDVQSFSEISSPSSSRPPSQTSSRSWSRVSVGSVPPRPDSNLSRRTLTPTKQISLQAVRRKEESDEPFTDHIDCVSVNGGPRNAWGDKESQVSELADHAAKLRLPKATQMPIDTSLTERMMDEDRNSYDPSVNEKIKGKKEVDEREDESSNDDDEDSSDDEPVRAPNELLIEFVDCLMKKDYKNADKLCKMILLYEPENAEALNFKPLIEEKMKLDEEAQNAEEDSIEEDDSDSDSDDDDSSSEDDSSDDAENDEDGVAHANLSGAASRNSDIFDVTPASDNLWKYSLRRNGPAT